MSNVARIDPEAEKIRSLLVSQKQLKVSRIVDGLSLDFIRNAINNQQRGLFEDTALIARKMMSDEVFSAALSRRINGLLRTEFRLEPSKKDDKIADTLAKATELLWFNSINEIDLEKFIRSYLNVGIAVAYLTWELKKGWWTPKFNYYSPEHVEFDQSENKWIFKGFRDGAQEEITPGKNNWVFLNTWAPGEIVGFASQLSNAWFAKELTLQDYIEANSKHGDNIAVISKDNDVNSIHSNQDDIDLFVSELQVKKRNGAVFLPAGYSIDFTNAHSGYTPAAYQFIISEFSRAVKIAVLGGNLGSDVSDQGSFAAASVHEAAEKNIILADAQKLSTCLKQQLIEPLIQFNFGTEWVDLAPWPTWAIAQADDNVSYVNLLNSVKSFIDGSPYKITNVAELLNHVGVDVAIKQNYEEEINDEKSNSSERSENSSEEQEDSAEEPE